MTTPAPRRRDDRRSADRAQPRAGASAADARTPAARPATGPRAGGSGARAAARSTTAPEAWLRRSDQLAVGGLVLAGLVAMAVYVGARWTESGRLVDLDQLPPQRAAFLVDVNTAQWPELAQLPGIGETLARRIVESRDEQGPFLDHSDLVRVRGIGPRTLDRVRPYLLPMVDAGNVAER